VLEDYLNKNNVKVENICYPEGKQPDELDKKMLDEILMGDF